MMILPAGSLQEPNRWKPSSVAGELLKFSLLDALFCNCNRQICIMLEFILSSPVLLASSGAKFSDSRTRRESSARRASKSFRRFSRTAVLAARAPPLQNRSEYPWPPRWIARQCSRELCDRTIIGEFINLTIWILDFEKD